MLRDDDVNERMRKMHKQEGFTLIELITVMVIVGILAVSALPRFFERSTFESRGFYDQTLSVLRYAQKSAIAQHRFVCVAFTANSITLTYGADATCGSNLTSPLGVTPYVVAVPNGSGITLSGYADFNFDALGRASPGQNITVSGNAIPIIVEAETGYVH